MGYSIGVDLGGTNIAVGVVDTENAQVIAKDSVKTNAPRAAELIADDIAMLSASVCEKAGLSLKSDVVGIGIASPGVIFNNVVHTAFNLGWRNVPLCDLVSERTGLRAHMGNDANVAAYAEAVAGCGKGCSSLVMLTLGTGVGGGIVVGGKIWEGFRGAAAELGHIIIHKDGRLCSCGKRGCLEAYCSASALIKETKHRMIDNPSSLLWNLTGGDIGRVGGKTAFDAMRMGDDVAREIVEEYIDDLAVGASNLVNVLQPEVLCFGGGISYEGETLTLPIAKKVAEQTYVEKEENRTRILPAKFRNDAGIIGAGILGADV